MAAPRKKQARKRSVKKASAPKKPAKKPGKKAGRKAVKPTGKPRRKSTYRKVPRGPRLNAAQQSIRDTLMLVRSNQGWTLAEIAQEAGVGTRTVKFALKAKREAQDNLLDKDVVEIVEGMVEELRTSIGDFEKMTMAAMEANNLPVAVGAKKGANEAREKLRELLQSVGALPHDLGTLTHVIDLRAVVVEINTAVEEFMTWMKSWVEAVEQEVELPAEKKVEVLDAAGRVVQRLDQIAGAPQNVGNEDPDQPGGDHHG